MDKRASPNGRKRMGGPLLVVGWLIDAILVAVLIGAIFTSHPRIIVASVITFLALSTVLSYVTFLWNKGLLNALEWIVFSYILPLMFVLLPPLFGVVMFHEGAGEGHGAIVADIATPAYYGLMLIVSYMFIRLVTEIKDHVGNLHRTESESWEFDRWGVAGAVCLLIGLVSALFYALPYGVGNLIQLTEPMKLKLFTFAGLMALCAPLLAIPIKLHLPHRMSLAEPDWKNYS